MWKPQSSEFLSLNEFLVKVFLLFHSIFHSRLADVVRAGTSKSS
nr:hypothetical protein [uncultured bacterium]